MENVVEQILARAGRPISNPISITEISSFSYLVETDRRYFCKSVPEVQSERLEAEALGLRELSKSSFLIPQVYGVGASDSGRSYLLLDWLDLGNPALGDWNKLARTLAEMHGILSQMFGLDHDNFIGATPQTNTMHDSWYTFFVLNRLIPQRELARTRGLWLDNWTPLMDSLIVRFESMIPSNIRPSLCHGDLWSGNCGFSEGLPSIFDPAVYYGHYEVDLAMTGLFGGFPASFYNAYYELNPPEPGYKERYSVYNLYHLLNHLNIFGRSYENQVDAMLRSLGS